MSLFQKVIDLAKANKKLAVAAAAVAVLALAVLLYAGANAEASQFNIHSRVAAQTSGVQVGTGYGCSSAEIVSFLVSEPSMEKSKAQFDQLAELGVCIAFGRQIPVYAMAPVTDVADGWNGPSTVWLLRIEYGDGTSDDFYWAIGKEMSDKLVEKLGATGL